MKLFAIGEIIPFSERRAAFCEFARKNGIIIKKIDRKNFISAVELIKVINIYKKTEKKRDFFSEKRMLEKAFEDIMNFKLRTKK